MNIIYQQYILDHYKHPRHHGEIVGAINSHCEDNPTCGDKICMDVLDGKIQFYGHGCAISQATASMLLEKVVIEKLTSDQLLNLKTDAILSLIKIPLSPNRLKCALLSLEVLQKLVSK